MHTIPCILIEISVKIRMTKNEGSYLSCVTNGEFYFSTITRKEGVICFSNENSNESSGFHGNFPSFRNGIPIGKAVDFYQYKIIVKSDFVWVMRI